MDYNAVEQYEYEEMPYSLEAEQSVLGSLLIQPELISSVIEYLPSSEMFFKVQHAKMYELFLGMFNMSKTIDFITVLEQVSLAKVFDNDQAAKVYLVNIMEIVPTTSNIAEYCRIIKDRYYRRKLILLSSEISKTSKEGEYTSDQILEIAEQKLFDLRKGRDSSQLLKIDKAIIQAYDKLQTLAENDNQEYVGLKTGFRLLDDKMLGLNNSDLILIAARPGMGKTSFALNIATNVAKYYDKDIAVFSLEMSSDQLVSRILSSEARIPSEAMRTGKLSSEQWVQLAACADILAKTNIYLDDTAGITVNEIKAKARRLKNLGLIVIDYLQLMSSGRRTENRVQEISQMTRGLKIMAKELNVPLILLSQLSRAIEQRSEHKPMLSDLRESGSIEQDADIVMFLYSDYYYDKDVTKANLAKCALEKNRHGQTGVIDLHWMGEFTKFSDLEVYRDAPPV